MRPSASGAVRRVTTWLRYDKKLLPFTFSNALDTYVENGAVKNVGDIDSIELLYRHGEPSPVYKSAYNPKDKGDIVSVRITPSDGSLARTYHVYADGKGIIKRGDKREYSTLS